MSIAIPYHLIGGYEHYYISVSSLALPSDNCFCMISLQLNLSQIQGQDYNYPQPRYYKAGNLSTYLLMDEMTRLWKNYKFDFSEQVVQDCFRYESSGQEPLDPIINYPSGGNFPIALVGTGTIPGTSVPIAFEVTGWGTLQDPHLSNYTGFFVPPSILYPLHHIEIWCDESVSGYLYFHCFGYTPA